MIYTAEIRWFIAGDLPGTVLDWFGLQGPLTEQPPRIDTYLCLAGCRSCGVKIREGRLEIKASTGPVRLPGISPEISGFPEGWVKWGTAPDESRALSELVRFEPSDRLVHVEKRRYLRWYNAESDGSPVATVPQGPGENCQVELSRLRTCVTDGSAGVTGPTRWREAAPWWSLCLEATSSRGAAGEHLATAANTEFRVLPPAELTKTNSMSYPAWLDALLKHAA